MTTLNHNLASRKRFLWGALFVLLLAAALRFHLIESQSFWNDEGNSARLSERSLELIIEGTASDIHPPLYYLIIRGWRELLGETEFALRAFSAFSGVLLVGCVLALGRRLVGPHAYAGTLAAGFLAAINPALVYYSQEVRMYELLALLAAASTLLMVMWMSSSRRKTAISVGYVLAVTAGLYTHYFFPAVLLAQNLVFFLWLLSIWRSSKRTGSEASFWTLFPRLMSWTAMMVASAILYAPWIPTYIEQAADRAPSTAGLLEFLSDGLRWSAFGVSLEQGAGSWMLYAIVLLAAAGLLFGLRRSYKGVQYTQVLLLNIVIPLILMWALGATRPAFFKFILVVIPPISLLAGQGLWWGWRWSIESFPFPIGPKDSGQRDARRLNDGWRLAVRFLLILCAAVLLVGSARSLVNMYYDPAFARVDYRGMALQIKDEAVPDAAVVLNAANQWEVFTYYHKNGAPVYPLPRGFPDPALIDQELSEIVDKHSRIYAIFWGEAERDPERLVERWLDAHSFKARDDWRGDVRFVTYAVPKSDEELVEIVSLTGEAVRFGNAIRLESAWISGDAYSPGDIIQFSFNWVTEEPLDTRYKIFLHLVDEQDQIMAQRDSEPGGGLALTTTWAPGVVVRDNHGVLVPFDTPPGQYTLLLGLYNAFDPADRLQVSVNEFVNDSLELATITIK